MITDTSGNVINLIPLVLTEGGETSPVTIRVVPETENETLEAEAAAEVVLWGKIGLGAYQNLSTNPLDVSEYFGEFTDVEIKAIAAESVPGVTRRYLFLGSRSGAAAGWLS